MQKQVLSQKQYDSRTIPYKRGEIQDRKWKCVCKSEKVYNVILDCVAVNGGDEEEQAKLKEQEIDYIEPTIDALVKTLGLDEAELRSMITDPATSGSRYQVLKRAFLWKKSRHLRTIRRSILKRSTPRQTLQGGSVFRVSGLKKITSGIIR